MGYTKIGHNTELEGKAFRCVADSRAAVSLTYGSAYFVQLEKGQIIGFATGDIYVEDSSPEFTYAAFKSTNPYANGIYLAAPDAVVPEGASVSTNRESAQTVLNEVLNKHQLTMQNLLVCSRYYTYLSAKNIPGIEEKAQGLAALFNNLKAREDSLKADGIIQQTKEGYDAVAAPLFSADLTRVVNKYGAISGTPAIGIAPVLIYLIITAVVSAVITGIVVYKLKKTNEVAGYELQLSDGFLEWMKKQDAATQAIVLKEMQDNSDAAYADGLNNSKSDDSFFGSLSKNIKTYGLVALGAFGFYKILQLGNSASKRI